MRAVERLSANYCCYLDARADKSILPPSLIYQSLCKTTYYEYYVVKTKAVLALCRCHSLSRSANVGRGCCSTSCGAAGRASCGARSGGSCSGASCGACCGGTTSRAIWCR